MIAEHALPIILGYFVGGLPIGLLVGRMKGIPDIRDHGSGNVGASNVMRLLGFKLGLFVWIADCIKGLAPVLLARHVFGLGPWGVGACGIAAALGHCYSPYLRLTGGRGVSTGLGAIIGFYWPAGVCALSVFAVVVAKTRYISLGSVLGSASGPFWMLLFCRLSADVTWATTPYVVAAGLTAAIVIIRHAPNIKRLREGTERKVGEKAK